MNLNEVLIEFNDVSIERGTTRILDHVNLSVPQSQHVAIVGPNGSGKSTLLKLLMKFLYPSVVDGRAGTVHILGKVEWNVWELRTSLGFVSSEIDHHFCMGRSARLNAMQSTLSGFYSAELEPSADSITDSMVSEAKRLLDLFRMDSKSTKQVGNMSTGERRRVLLARALTTRPMAIVLDEPTTGLDIRARAELLGILNVLACDGTQIVLVTHHLEEILPCIHRTILLKGGKLFRDGETQAALTEELISELFDTPIRMDRNPQGYFQSWIE